MFRRVAQPTAFLRSISSPTDELTLLANRYGSDKGDLWFDKHGYTRIYAALFEDIRNEPLQILEIGLLNSADRGWRNVTGRLFGTAVGSRAPSLQMWATYFPRARIFGFDINEFEGVEAERCKIIRGDMGDRNDLAQLVTESGRGFDIVIDDASHASHHQQIALGYLFEHVSPGGLYIIEDLGFQPTPVEEKEAEKTRDILRRARQTGNLTSRYLTEYERKYFDEHAASIEFFDSSTGGPISRFAGALAVIRKR